jgi:hypothetical protein
MNARPVHVLILAAALCASGSAQLFAASQNEIPASFTVRTLVVASNGDMKVERGMSRGDVAFALRYKAREELSPDVWAYSGYHADSTLADARQCGTVVITFAQDRVVDLQLVNKPAFAVIAANAKLGSSARNLASR